MPPNIGTYALSDAENELAGMGHGTELNQVTNILGVFNRAARRVLGDVDPQETKVVAQMPTPIFNGVYDYQLFPDLKGNKIIDLYPVGNRTLLDNYEQRYNKNFNLWKFYSIQTSLTPKYSSGYRSIQINAPNLINGTQINDAAAVNDNGLWVTTQNASNPQQNTVFFTNGAASSLQITLNQTGVTSSGDVSNSTMTPVNLTQNYQNF